MSRKELEALNARYLAAMHAVQSGVAMDLQHDPASGTPKHLRVGVNSALVNQAALVRLLITKGLITEMEYMTALAEEAEAEQRRYEELLSKRHGGNIRLA